MQNCPECGTENWDTVTRCVRCRASLVPLPPTPRKAVAGGAAKRKPDTPAKKREDLSLGDMAATSLRWAFASIPALILVSFVFTLVSCTRIALN